MQYRTAIFQKIRRYRLAVSLLASITAAGPLSSTAWAQTDLGALDGRAIADGAEPGNTNQPLPAETLVENGWNFDDPDSIPGFGALPSSDPAID